MFHVLTITYLQPPDVIAVSRPAHVEWIKSEIEAGRLILTGRLESGNGGILITADISAEEADELTADDPYLLAGVVRYDRVSFDATLRAPGL